VTTRPPFVWQHLFGVRGELEQPEIEQLRERDRCMPLFSALEDTDTAVYPWVSTYFSDRFVRGGFRKSIDIFRQT